jgi:hypothetical protein
MHSQLVVVFLVGLAASAYALDLSHAQKRSVEVEPRIFNLINDLYAQVIYPPLNHVVTSLALLGAQFLAGVSQNGIPAPGGRTLHPSAEQLRGIFDNIWNNVLGPPIENALSGVALMAAQVLAGLGTNGVNLGSLFGKRDLSEAEMRGLSDSLFQAFNDVFANVIQKPLEDALAGGALMLAQVLAGLGTNGVNLGSLLGKRDLSEAEMRGLGDALTQAFNDVFTNVIQKPLENALAGGALMLAQVLAGLGTNGVNLGSLLGKRDLAALTGRQEELRSTFAGFSQSVYNSLHGVWSNIFKNPIEQALQSSALMAAQVLAGLGTNGVSIGKRDLTAEARGPMFDSLFGHVTGVYTNSVKPVIENGLSAAALHLAGVLANFSQNGFGRR